MFNSSIARWNSLTSTSTQGIVLQNTNKQNHGRECLCVCVCQVTAIIAYFHVYVCVCVCSLVAAVMCTVPSACTHSFFSSSPSLADAGGSTGRGRARGTVAAVAHTFICLVVMEGMGSDALYSSSSSSLSGTGVTFGIAATLLVALRRGAAASSWGIDGTRRCCFPLYVCGMEVAFLFRVLCSWLLIVSLLLF